MNNNKYTTEQLQYYFEDRIKQLYPKFEKHPTLIQLDGLYHRIKQHRPYKAYQQSLHHIFQYCIKYSDAQLRWKTNDNYSFKGKINQLYRLRHKVLQYKRYEDQLILIKQNILQRNQQYEEGNTHTNYVSFFDNVVFSGNSLQVQHKNKLIQLDQSKDFINSMYSDWYKSLLYTQQQWMVEGHINTATIQTDYIPLQSQFNVQFKLNEESHNSAWHHPQYAGQNRDIIIKYKRCLLYDVDTEQFYVTLKLKDVTTNENTYSNAVRNMIHYMIRGKYRSIPFPISISMEDSVGKVHYIEDDDGYIQKMETYIQDNYYLLDDQMINSQVLYNSIVKFKCNIVDDYKPRIINLEINLFTLMMGPNNNAHNNKIQQHHLCTNTVKLSFEVQMSNYINHNIKYQPQHLPDYNKLDKITYIARDNNNGQ